MDYFCVPSSCCRLAWVRLLPAGTLRVSQTLPPMVDALADGDAAQNGRAGVDHHVVLDDRMARMALLQRAVGIRREALGAQRDGLVDAHALADDGGLADHHAGAVVDEEAAADLRARVDVDAGGRMRNLRD